MAGVVRKPTSRFSSDVLPAPEAPRTAVSTGSDFQVIHLQPRPDRSPSSRMSRTGSRVSAVRVDLVGSQVRSVSRGGRGDQGFLGGLVSAGRSGRPGAEGSRPASDGATSVSSRTDNPPSGTTTTTSVVARQCRVAAEVHLLVHAVGHREPLGRGQQFIERQFEVSPPAQQAAPSRAAR